MIAGHAWAKQSRVPSASAEDRSGHKKQGVTADMSSVMPQLSQKMHIPSHCPGYQRFLVESVSYP
jgi:hypothetical protein